VRPHGGGDPIERRSRRSTTAKTVPLRRRDGSKDRGLAPASARLAGLQIFSVLEFSVYQ
jgi:hypothetical protein